MINEKMIVFYLKKGMADPGPFLVIQD